MSNVRKFWILNESGETKSLNAEDGIFLTEPSGLGITYSNTYYTKTLGFYGRSKTAEQQGTVSGTLIFFRNNEDSPSPYVTYRQLIDFLERSKKLYLKYCPADVNDKYYIAPIYIQSIEKGEMDHTFEMLSCPISMTRMTMWYTKTAETAFDSPSIYEGYKIGTSVIGSVPLGYDNNGGYSAEVVNDGQIDGGVIVKFSGTGTYFSLKCIGKDTDKLYGICDFYVNMLQGDSFEFSSCPGNKYLKWTTGDGKEHSLLDYVDVTTNPFFQIPYTENCKITLTGTDVVPDEGMPRIETFSYYRGV